MSSSDFKIQKLSQFSNLNDSDLDNNPNSTFLLGY